MLSNNRGNKTPQYSEGEDADPQEFRQTLPWLIPFSSDDKDMSDDSGYEPDDDSDNELEEDDKYFKSFYENEDDYK